MGAKPSLSQLSAFPPEVHLSTAKARQNMIVQAAYSDGVTRDVTAQAKYTLADPKRARLDHGTLLPITDGRTELRVAFGGLTVVVPVVVTNATEEPPISFKLDVMPVFLKAGCNAGACHGSSRGKDGFRLSLFGYDPDGDYFRLTREQIGRRVNLGIPEESLIVQKGLGAVQHTGGVRFGTNSQLCKTLIAWLSAGAPKDSTNVARLIGIEVFPKTALLEGSNALQRFIVRARYSDATERDVTRLAVFISNNEICAKVAEDGVVIAGQRGEAFIQARFGEFNVGAQVIVIPKGLPFRWPEIAARNYIDEAVFAKLKKLRLNPAEVCDDTTFIRRAYLDITGTLPTAEEVREFTEVAESDHSTSCDQDSKGRPPAVPLSHRMGEGLGVRVSANHKPISSIDFARRERLVDQLLARKEFAEMWVMKWAELLEIRSRDNRVYPKAAFVYFEWLRDQMLANVPLDRIVQSLLTASGSNFRNPAANYYQIEPDTLKLAENTAQAFMGMRIQCAQCHNHPFDRWTMNDYYGFAAFFAQVGHKPGDDPRETVIFDRSDGEVKHPVTGKAMPPRFLGGQTPEIKGESRRQALALWLTSSENPFFARNVANIVWAHFMGRGIIEPVDDVRISNPASNAELLDALAARFIEFHYDFKKLVRDICCSRTYQLDTRPNESNALDDRNFSRAAIRRIRAEILLDCISQVTGTQDKFPGLPRGARAVEIADGNTANYFLTTFGRATRTSVCTCDVKTDPNLSQALHLLNGDTIQGKIEQGGVVKGLLKAGQTPDQIIENLYLRCFSRKPTSEELGKLKNFLNADANPQQILNDVFWSLLNAKEFVFNH